MDRLSELVFARLGRALLWGLACLALPTPALAQILVPAESEWSYSKGIREPSEPQSAWRTLDFDSATWPTGKAPFYYDSGSVYSGNTALPDMRNNYTTLYLRKPFVVEDAESITGLTVRHFLDDGFVVWINGTYLTQQAKTGNDFDFDALATSSASEPVSWLGQTLPITPGVLINGTNLLAVQAFNVTRTSSDFIVDLEVAAIRRDQHPPSILRIEPPPGTLAALASVRVTFTEPVVGLAASDLLLNQRPAVSMAGSGATYTFVIDPPPEGRIEVSWDPDARITDLATPPNSFDPTGANASWTYQIVDNLPPDTLTVHPAPGALLREFSQVEIRFSEPVTGVDAGDLLINNRPAASVTGDGSGPYRFEVGIAAAGDIQVQWANAHGITDLAATPNGFTGGAWSYRVDPTLPNAQVRIAEFLTSYAGDRGLRDEDDELQDWIELHNHGTEPVALGGWSLSDDPDDPGRWVFPNVTLGPGAYLQVFASGKDRRETRAGAVLHTNFKLATDGEYLGLFNAESPRRPVSEFAPAYPPQRPDHSYGADPRGGLRYFANPTPGSANGESSIVSALSPVEFNVQRGVFDHPFDLHLASPDPAAEIRYTFDGSEPSATTGLPYRDPLRIEGSTVIRAAAFRPGSLPSISVTHSYLFPTLAAHQPDRPPGTPATWIDTQGRTWTADYGMDPEIVDAPAYRDRVITALKSLPAISLVTRPTDMFDNANGIYPKSQARGPAWERAGSVEFLDPDAGLHHQVNCGIQMQGNSVRDPVKTAKHSFRLVFKGDYGPSKLEYPVFPDSPVREFDTLILRADFNNSWMHWNGAQRLRGQRVRDAWIKDSQRAMGGLASRNRFFHLYVNGLYWGVYDATERPDAAFGASYLGGRKADYDVVNEGQLVDGNFTAYSALRSLSNLADPTQFERMRTALDLDAYVDYLLLHFYVGHEDWFTDKNWYALRRRTPAGPFRYLSWDGELILNSPSHNIVTRTDQPSGLHTKLLESPEYRLRFADRIQRHLLGNGALTPDAAAARYRNWAERVAPAMVAESARWGDYRRDVHAYSSGPYLLYTADDHFNTERARLLNTYFPGRTTTLLAQLKAAGLYPSNVAAPTFDTPPGWVPRGRQITLTGGPGTLHLTTDGSDPRIPHTGAVAPNAVSDTATLTLQTSTLIKARWLRGSEWSALAEAAYRVDSVMPRVAITEIHYHPEGGDPYEFLELHNPDTLPITLDGGRIEGVQWVFPPGSTLQPGATWILASGLSPSAFAARYPGVPVYGHFQGSLSDRGERLAVIDRDGQTLFEVAYRDRNGWPEKADGQGASLELVSPSAPPDVPASWQASASRDGTPGRFSPAPSTPAVRLNEVMAWNTGRVPHGGATPDWVEIQNTGTEPADLSGWRLTDHGSAPPLVFPAGTRLSPGEFLVVWCDGPTSEPGWHAEFDLDREGETLSLLNATGDRIDALSFGPQATAVSLGRHPTLGTWLPCNPTPGTPNAIHDLGDPSTAIINESSIQTPGLRSPWIELYNRNATLPLDLRGYTLVAGAQRVTFQLPVLIDPQGYLLIPLDARWGASSIDPTRLHESDPIQLLDPNGALIDAIRLDPNAPGRSRGRLPDGSQTVTEFSLTTSPGAANYLPMPEGLLLNEALVQPAPDASDSGSPATGWLELANPAQTPVSLNGWTLRLDADPDQTWVPPAGLTVPGRGYLRLNLDAWTHAKATQASNPQERLVLRPTGGRLEWLTPSGRVHDALTFGHQIAGQSIGRTSSGWHLLSWPTPGEPNALPSPLASAAQLRINEWVAAPARGDDWIELFNPAPQAVALAGLQLADRPANGTHPTYRFPPLSFIGPSGYVLVTANDQSDPDGAPFRLASLGEAIVLTDALGVPLDAVFFGPQTLGSSQGRMPDGAEGLFQVFGTPTPARKNGATPPPAAPRIREWRWGGGTLVLGVSTESGGLYRVEASPDLRTWEPVMQRAATGAITEFRLAEDGMLDRAFFRVVRFDSGL